MTDERAVARVALACLDLTSLNDDDTAATVDSLCERALGERAGGAAEMMISRRIWSPACSSATFRS